MLQERMAETTFAIVCGKGLNAYLEQHRERLLAPLEQRFQIRLEVQQKPMSRAKPYNIEIT